MDPLHTYINFESSSNQFIPDASASHHMVNSASLLANLQPLSLVKQIRIGDLTHLAATAICTLQIRGTIFAIVLLVPNLASNLVSVGAIPTDTDETFSNIKLRFTSSEPLCLPPKRSMTSILSRQANTTLLTQTTLIIERSAPKFGPSQCAIGDASIRADRNNSLDAINHLSQPATICV